ncbi:MAG: bifunctional folylpolyglutamate synthase/dihydrofolate synthase, partial [Epsilonproteobacteria bacterium]|nr:bifunctional folylpolyglutamate synthase/dihydrofolate synthase [Campylobacterota bacterium]
DKDAKEVLSILKPKIDMVEIIELKDNKRAINKERLKEILKELNIPFRDFENIKEDKEYLVFGSFYVVEEFLKRVED